MARLDVTPWARKALTGADYATIQDRAPANATVDIGMARKGDWTCRLRVGGVVIGEAYHVSTAIGAFHAAMADMREKAA